MHNNVTKYLMSLTILLIPTVGQCEDIQAIDVNALNIDLLAEHQSVSTEVDPLHFSVKADWFNHYRVGENSGIQKSTFFFQPSIDYKFNSELEFHGSANFWYNLKSDISNLQASGVERDAELDEVYLRATFSDNLTGSFGRQVLAWGQSDFLLGAQLTDVVNPRDFREIALVDLEQARRPLLMSTLRWIGSSLTLEAVATHEEHFHVFDDPYGDFDPYKELRNNGIHIHQQSTRVNPLVDGYVRVSGQWSNSDFGLMVGKGYDKSPLLIFDAINSSINQLALSESHVKYSQIGISLNSTQGSFVFKTEHLFAHQKAFLQHGDTANSALQLLGNAAAIHDSVQSMVGADYFGFNDVVLTMEVNNEVIKNWADNLYLPKNNGHLSALASWKPSGSRFEWNAVLLQPFPYHAQVIRLENQARINDNFRVTMGAISFHSTDSRSFYWGFRNEDRVYVNISYEL